MGNINCMKMSGPGEIPRRQAQELWVDALSHARDASKAAKVVIGTKLSCIEYIHDALDNKWEKRLRVRARFDGNGGCSSLDQTMQFVASMDHSKAEIPDIEWLRHSTHTLLRSIVADGVVVAKLALVHANAIAEMAEVMKQGDTTFDPKIWSDSIVNAYMDQTVAASLNGSSAIDNTDYHRKRNDAISMGEVANQLAKTDPAFREHYR